MGRSSLLQPAAHLQAELGRDSSPSPWPDGPLHLYKEGQGSLLETHKILSSKP